MTDLALFSADAQIGKGMRGPAEFPTCRELLAFMDRLGVSRSLVWNVEARDLGPTSGNRRLMQELDSLGPARQRLLPSFVVAPSMLSDAAVMEELTEAFSSGRVRALRLMGRSQSYRLRHIEPLVRRLARFRPLVLVDVRDVGEDAELLAFCQTLPETPVVCLHAMWPSFYGAFSLLDLLARCPNLRVGTGWMHMHGILARVAKEFGPDRQVFALGPIAHAGAAIGALARAELPEEVRAAIAHGTLDNLLGARATPPLRMPSLNPFWETFLRGQPLDVPIVDAHGHMSLSATWGRAPKGEDDQFQLALRDMDRLGVRTFIVCSGQALHGEPVEGNLLLQQQASGYGERFRGYVGFNPYYQESLTPRLDEFFSQPFFVGFKLLCSYWQVPVTDPRLRPAYEYAQRRRLPILLHTWDDHYNTPAMLREVVKEYPDAAFLLGHSGGGDAGRREAHELAAANQNVYLEWCGSFCSSIPWETTLSMVDPSRVVYGSDALGHDMTWELARFLSLDLPQEVLLPILGENMGRVLARADVPGADAFRVRAS